MLLYTNNDDNDNNNDYNKRGRVRQVVGADFPQRMYE